MHKLSESVLRRLAMSKTFRHTNWVLVLLASGALVVLFAFGALLMATAPLPARTNPSETPPVWKPRRKRRPRNLNAPRREPPRPRLMPKRNLAARGAT